MSELWQKLNLGVPNPTPNTMGTMGMNALSFGNNNTNSMGSMGLTPLTLSTNAPAVMGSGISAPNLWEADFNPNAISEMATTDFWNLSNPDAWKVGSQALGALTNTYLGFQQLGQAEDQLAFQKEAFWTNYNQQQEDRRLAAERRQIAKG